MNLDTRVQALRQAQSNLNKAVFRIAATCPPFGHGSYENNLVRDICVYARAVHKLREELSRDFKRYLSKVSQAHRGEVQRQLEYAAEMLEQINFQRWNKVAA